MRQLWEADASYWTRIPNADLLAAFPEAPIAANQPERPREAVIKAHVKLKKDDLAAKVGEAFAGIGYLSDVRATSASVGAYELTDAGVANTAQQGWQGMSRKEVVGLLAALFVE